MTRYLNLGGKSGVYEYEIGETSIKVRFAKYEYTYNYLNPGERQVKKMKTFAINGKNLSAYIAQEVKDKYRSRKKY